MLTPLSAGTIGAGVRAVDVLVDARQQPAGRDRTGVPGVLPPAAEPLVGTYSWPLLCQTRS